MLNQSLSHTAFARRIAEPSLPTNYIRLGKLTMRAWYCAQTEPNCEYRAKKYLELDGIPAFLPTYLTKDKSRHLKVNLLIRGYIFFSLDDPVLWPRIRTVSGILKVITNITVQLEDTLWYSMPSLCGSQAIENLRKLCLSMDEFRRDGGGRTKTLNYLTAGVHVRMRAGTVNQLLQEHLVV